MDRKGFILNEKAYTSARSLKYVTKFVVQLPNTPMGKFCHDALKNKRQKLVIASSHLKFGRPLLRCGRNSLKISSHSFGCQSEVEKWMGDKLWEEWLPLLGDVFCKGKFKGIFYKKFGTTAERDSVVNWFRKSSIKIEGHPVWSKPDLPLHPRIIKSLLFGTRYICDRALWVDENKNEVLLNGKEVLRASIRDGHLDIVYGESWEKYLHDPDFRAFNEMVTSLRGKLAQGEGGKGGGKKGGKFKSKFQED